LSVDLAGKGRHVILCNSIQRSDCLTDDTSANTKTEITQCCSDISEYIKFFKHAKDVVVYVKRHE